MPDTEIFLSLAEIAGIFVGFGALIAVRSSGPADRRDVLMVGMMVWAAIIVVIQALTPVVVSRFGITGHVLWVASSVVALLLFLVGDSVVARASSDRRAFMAAAPWGRRWKQELEMGVVTWIPATVALALVILGPLPEQEAALYFLATTLFLLMTALLLLMMVFRTGFYAMPTPGFGEGEDAGVAPA